MGIDRSISVIVTVDTFSIFKGYYLAFNPVGIP